MDWDWNWYFSALAQSSAAIVGLYGTFIVNEVLNMQINFKEDEEELISAIHVSEHLEDQCENRYFE